MTVAEGAEPLLVPLWERKTRTEEEADTPGARETEEEDIAEELQRNGCNGMREERECE